MALAENQEQRAKLEAPKQKVRSEAVTGSDFIIELSCRIDNQMKDMISPCLCPDLPRQTQRHNVAIQAGRIYLGPGE